MRILMMAAISAMALGAAPAAAQVYGAPIPAPGGMGYGQPMVQGQIGGRTPMVDVQAQVPTAGPHVWQDGRWMALPPSQNIARQNDPHRWGYEQDGRWEGGSRAPGGWGAYRRMGRGQRMPNYWLSAQFGVGDYLSFGLAAPPQGYRWIRYYDDAVLVDYQGNVWDSMGGISWGGGSSSGSHSNSYSYSSAGIQQVDPNQYYAQQQYPGGYAPSAAYGPPAAQQQGYGYGSGASYGSSYSSSSYYGMPSSSVTIIPGPVTTTTVIEEEIVEEVATTTTYVRSAPRRVVRRVAPVRHRAVRRAACCQCRCR